MAIVGPYVALAEFLGRGKVYSVGGAQEKISRGGKNQRACSAEQRLSDRNEIPLPGLCVVQEEGGQLAGHTRR